MPLPPASTEGGDYIEGSMHLTADSRQVLWRQIPHSVMSQIGDLSELTSWGRSHYLTVAMLDALK